MTRTTLRVTSCTSGWRVPSASAPASLGSWTLRGAAIGCAYFAPSEIPPRVIVRSSLERSFMSAASQSYTSTATEQMRLKRRSWIVRADHSFHFLNRSRSVRETLIDDASHRHNRGIRLHRRGIRRRANDLRCDALIDVRRRRGMRGGVYAWANRTRLEALCAALGIAYESVAELAPTEATRQVQREIDARAKVAKRSRSTLDPAFVARYLQQIDADAAVDAAKRVLDQFERPVLLCVERDAAACHRSLVASRLAIAMKRTIVNM